LNRLGKIGAGFATSGDRKVIQSTTIFGIMKVDGRRVTNCLDIVVGETMSIQQVTLPLPEGIYLRFQQIAIATRQSLTDVLLHAVAVGSPPSWEDAPVEFQADLAALDRLDDTALWRIARSRAAVDMDRFQALLDNNANGCLTPDEQNELSQLQREANRLMLCKAHAAALLRWRGHTLPPAATL
jgi:hypothetical protein